MKKNNVSLIGDHVSRNFEPCILSTVEDVSGKKVPVTSEKEVQLMDSNLT